MIFGVFPSGFGDGFGGLGVGFPFLALWWILGFWVTQGFWCFDFSGVLVVFWVLLMVLGFLGLEAASLGFFCV